MTTPTKGDKMDVLDAPPLRRALAEIERDPTMGRAIRELRDRPEFDDRTALLAGVALDPAARSHYEQATEAMWQRDSERNKGITQASEVVIGGGIHAAIYCAVRASLGYKMPLVIEGRRVGGSFAVSRGPSFFLNSRNRPGPLGLPGEGGALNAVPGFCLQPSHLSDSEFQRNSDLGFIIRAVLAQNAQMLVGRKVVGLRRAYGTERPSLILEDGTKIPTNRVIAATGLGAANRNIGGRELDNDRVLTFAQFMERFDSPFPLRGMDRVAVIGGGDSARTVIEALVGKGPAEHMSVAALDRPETIDWYGCPQSTCESWELRSRSRYRSIGRLLPNPGAAKPPLVNPRPLAESIGAGFECVYVNERPYDYAVIATGFTNYLERVLGYEYTSSQEESEYEGRMVARYSRRGAGEVFTVGPAANLALTGPENNSTTAFSTPENLTALFRYAPRTASLAASLPGEPRPEPKPPASRKRKPKQKKPDIVAPRSLILQFMDEAGRPQQRSNF